MPNETSDSKGRSIFKDVVDIIDKRLGLKVIGKSPQYGHKESCQKLLEPLVDLGLETLIDEIYEQIKSNWRDSDYHQPSKENWRFEKQKRIGDKNKKEVAFERAIVNVPAEIWSDAACWVNHVPTASGFVDPDADRHRAIDLVYHRRDDSYDFIELKVDEESGGTPLFAAIEILLYGILYMFSREKAQELGYDGIELLKAKGIHLRVLAPTEYYAPYNLSWLEKSINDGLVSFRSQRKFSFELDFKFETLSLTLTRSSPWVPGVPKRTSP